MWVVSVDLWENAQRSTTRVSASPRAPDGHGLGAPAVPQPRSQAAHGPERPSPALENHRHDVGGDNAPRLPLGVSHMVPSRGDGRTAPVLPSPLLRVKQRGTCALRKWTRACSSRHARAFVGWNGPIRFLPRYCNIAWMSEPLATTFCCAICLADDLPIESKATVYGCRHIYCDPCIRRWAHELKKSTCPLCKQAWSCILYSTGDILVCRVCDDDDDIDVLWR